MKDASAWMPLYIGDYLADTMHLNAAEHGAYLLLIMHYWRTGPLPDDDRALAAIARTERSDWAEVGPVVRAFFRTEEGSLHHKRIDEELEKAIGNLQQRRAAARARWERVCARNAAASSSNGDARSEGAGGSGERQPQRAKSRKSVSEHASADADAHAPAMRKQSPSPSPSPEVREIPSVSCRQDGDERVSANQALPLDLAATEPAGKPPSPPAIVREAVEIWNRVAKGKLPGIREVDGPRSDLIRKRLKGYFADDLEAFEQFVKRAARAPWLTGDNDRGWRANIEFCLKPEKLKAIREGQYDPRHEANATGLRTAL